MKSEFILKIALVGMAFLMTDYIAASNTTDVEQIQDNFERAKAQDKEIQEKIVNFGRNFSVRAQLNEIKKEIEQNPLCTEEEYFRMLQKKLYSQYINTILEKQKKWLDQLEKLNSNKSNVEQPEILRDVAIKTVRDTGGPGSIPPWTKWKVIKGENGERITVDQYGNRVDVSR